MKRIPLKQSHNGGGTLGKIAQIKIGSAKGGVGRETLVRGLNGNHFG
jgi:hypothetical protein